MGWTSDRGDAASWARWLRSTQARTPRRPRGTRAPLRVATICAALAVSVFPAASAQAAPAGMTAPARTFPICPLLPTGPALADEGPLLRWELATYRPTTTYNYWSVVATRGSQGYDPDITLYDRGGCRLGSSLLGGFSPTDWVALDNNAGRLTTGTYPTQVLGHSGNTSPVKYNVQFVQGRQTLATNAPSTEQSIGHRYSSWLVDIRDVYLTAGQTYTFTVSGGLSAMHVLGSSTSDPQTWTKTRANADASLVLPGTDLDTPQTGSLSLHVPQSGWYGVLFVRDGWWGAPVSVRVSVA